MRNMVIVVIIVITGERMSSPTLIQLGLEYQKIPKIIGEVELTYFPKGYELASVVLRQSAL